LTLHNAGDFAFCTGLLGRIDEIAKRAGLSRSALLAKGARIVIATETGS
jgi:hypothetical protein